MLLAIGVNPTRADLRDSINRVDPEGRADRLIQAVPITEYSAHGYLRLVHMDA